MQEVNPVRVLRLSGMHIVTMICILGIDDIWISPELVLVICGFKQHRVAYLCMSLFLSPMTLKSFPHLSWHCMKLY